MDIGTLGVYAALFLTLYFEVILLISFIEKRPEQKTALRPKHFPTATIVVPCFNEERTVAATIESLLQLDYPKDKLSIMVIDDGSRDNTPQIAQALAAAHPQVSFYRKENGGKYTALNYAIEHTQSELIGCLDADSFVAPDALLEMAKRFESDQKIMAIIPAMKVHRPHTMLELMQAVEYTFGIFIKKMFDNLSAISVLPGPFSVYRRKVFDIVGPFRHAHNTEDMEIAFRMHIHGLKIANAHTAHVYTTVPKTLRTLIKQRTRWSQGFLQNSRDYAHMYFNRRYGHFGMLVLPVGLTAFLGGLYMAFYLLFNLVSSAVQRGFDWWTTGVPLQMPRFHLEWFYINTDSLIFVIGTVLVLSILATLLGGRLSETHLSLKAFLSYFLFFGLIAPFWLVRAAWGALLARESAWR